MLKCAAYKDGRVVAISLVNGEKIKRLFYNYEDAAKWHNSRIQALASISKAADSK